MRELTENEKSWLEHTKSCIRGWELNSDPNERPNLDDALRTAGIAMELAKYRKHNINPLILQMIALLAEVHLCSNADLFKKRVSEIFGDKLPGIRPEIIDQAGKVADGYKLDLAELTEEGRVVTDAMAILSFGRGLTFMRRGLEGLRSDAFTALGKKYINQIGDKMDELLESDIFQFSVDPPG